MSKPVTGRWYGWVRLEPAMCAECAEIARIRRNVRDIPYRDFVMISTQSGWTRHQHERVEGPTGPRFHIPRNGEEQHYRQCHHCGTPYPEKTLSYHHRYCHGTVAS